MRYTALLAAATAAVLVFPPTVLRADPLTLDQPSTYRQVVYTADDGERACRAQARAQRLDVVRILSRTVHRSGPFATGSTIVMEVRRAGSLVRATCEHVRRTNAATISLPPPPVVVGPDYNVAQRACEAEARSRGLNLVRVTTRAPIRSGPAITGARLGVELRRGAGPVFNGSCDYTIRSRTAVLSFTEPRPPIATPDYAAAERACSAQARREGLTPVRFVAPREPIRRGVALIGARLGMELRRGAGRVFNGTCEWTIRSGAAVLSYREPIAPLPVPDYAAAERACSAQASREGLTRVRFVAPREPIRSGPTLTGARLGMVLRRGSGPEFNGTCDWTIRTGAAVLRTTEPPIPDNAAYRTADAACLAALRATGRELERIRTRELVRDAGGRPHLVHLELVLAERGFREPNQRCTYNFRTARAELTPIVR